MKVAHLISNYFPNVGGAQACIHHVANRITERGHETVVITPRMGKGGDKGLSYYILRINPLVNRFLFASFSLGKVYLENILARIQRNHNFDIWQVTVGYPLGAAAADFFNKNGIPCVLRCAGEDIQMLPEIGYGYRLNKAIDKIVRKNYRNFTALITAGEGTKKDYLSLGIPEKKIHIIANGVDCGKFKSEMDREGIRKGLGIGGGQKLILTVGRSHPKKGFKCIPEIIKRLLQRGADFVWLLIGKGCGDIKALADKQGVSEYLIVKEMKQGVSGSGVPCIPNNELIGYYKASDLFVFPTLIELFAKVIIEAMAAGLPIVTTDAAGVDDMIENGRNGLKNRVNDIEGLTDSIIKLFSDSVLAKQLGENALRDSENYDWKIITDKYMALYKKVGMCA